MEKQLQQLANDAKETKSMLFQFSGVLDRQEKTLSAINANLEEMKAVIREVTSIAKNQVQQKEKIKNIENHCLRTNKHFEKDIQNIYKLIGETKCAGHEARIAVVEKQVEHNAKVNEAQDTRAWGVLQKIIFAIVLPAIMAVGGYFFGNHKG